MSMGRSSMGKQIAVTRSSRDGGAKKVAFGGTKKMKAGGSTPSKPEPKYKDLRDRLDGGGPGKSGSTFSGGPLAKVGNALGIKPMAPAMATSGGGADSGQAAARVDAQRAAGLAARNYKGNSENSGGNGPSAVSAGAGAADAAKAPTKVMKQTYVGGPAAGYRPGVDPEHQYFKTEEVDATTPEVKPMKKGGMVRGCGVAIRGKGRGRIV